MCSSPRASIGLSMLPASIEPSAAPAPTTVCTSSTNSRMRPSDAFTSASTALSRSSNSPRYLAPATQRAEVQAEDHLVTQALRDVAAGDALREALDDGGLADARIADQHRVVLGLPGQDLDDAADLGVAPDDRVEPAGRGVGHEVPAVLLERLVGGLGHRGRDALVAPNSGQGLQECRSGDALLLQQTARARGRRAEREHRQHQVLDRDVVVLQPASLLLGVVEQPRQLLRDGYLTGCDARPAHPRAPLKLDFQFLAQLAGIGADLAHQARHDAFGLVEQRRAAGARRPPRYARSAAPWSARRAAASCDFCVSRFGSMRYPPTPRAASHRCLEHRDPVQQIDDESGRRVVEREAGAQPLHAADRASWLRANHKRPAESRLASRTPRATSLRTRSGCRPAAAANSSRSSRGARTSA